MIELYKPPHCRVYGCYVRPFLPDNTLVAGRELMADRAQRTLMLQGAFPEPGHGVRRVAPEVMDKLDLMRAWLGLDRVAICSCRELAAPMRA
ncbi:MAG TPA: hypothetical protein VKF14_17495 [Candidatus Dormibacteraeota bacterium]|nr:hypothetical protein [Candidatus Dormibacteraeota bacterium]